MWAERQLQAMRCQGMCVCVCISISFQENSTAHYITVYLLHVVSLLLSASIFTSFYVSFSLSDYNFILLPLAFFFFFVHFTQKYEIVAIFRGTWECPSSVTAHVRKWTFIMETESDNNHEHVLRHINIICIYKLSCSLTRFGYGLITYALEIFI